MKINAKYKDYLGIEKRFNESLMPYKLDSNDIMNLIFLITLQLGGSLYFIVQLFSYKPNFNFLGNFGYIIIGLYDLIFAFGITFVLMECMKEKNKTFLFIKRGNEFFKVNKYFYDIADTQTIQYAKTNKLYEVQSEKIEIENFYTEIIDQTKEIEMIKSKNKLNLNTTLYNILSFLKLIIIIFIPILSPIPSLPSLIHQIIHQINNYYIFISPILTTIIVFLVGISMKKLKKNNFENELIDKLNEDYNFENNNKKNEHQLLPIKNDDIFRVKCDVKGNKNIKIKLDENIIETNISNNNDVSVKVNN
ncbi:hypothetical protein [Staphylococcus hominis]|uniref:hypothetical protein n=1 Tax=Staphylococcus hominis TaxID=1290 RepID=UPI001E5725C9|nr:hypothetical protein [Staphylococcus hominis]MCD8763058.1 hypothetical protein [Staphylococcus hominis]